MPSLSALLAPFLDATLMVVGLIVFTRLAGLRSFSKMSGYEFAITVAMGSVLASVVVTKGTGPLVGLAALGALFVVQAILSRLRVASEQAQESMDNAPLLIMRGAQVLDDNLARAKMTRSDLMAKLREANVLNTDQIHAVVFEQTGDVSVLHGEGDFDPALMEGVRESH